MCARLTHRATTVVGLAAAMLVMAACGGSGAGHSTSARIESSATAAGSDHHEDADTVCRLVTRADASALFGAPATRNTSSSIVATDGACIWNATSGSLHYTLVAHINDTAFPLDAAEAARMNIVRGVGERAYMSAVTPSGSQIWFVKNGRVVRLGFSVAGARDAALPPAVRQKVAVPALARAVAARM